MADAITAEALYNMGGGLLDTDDCKDANEKLFSARYTTFAKLKGATEHNLRQEYHIPGPVVDVLRDKGLLKDTGQLHTDRYGINTSDSIQQC